MATEDIEQRLTDIISKVIGSDEPAPTLAGDVVMFSAWYKAGPDVDEVQYDTGKSLVELIGGDSNRRLLSKQIKAYVIAYAPSADVDEIVRLSMERIIGWQDWYPSWVEDRIYELNLEAEAGYSAIYGESDYGAGDADNGSDGAFV